MRFKIEENSEVDVIYETNYGEEIKEKTYSLAPLLGINDTLYDSIEDAINFATYTSVLDFDDNDIYPLYTGEYSDNMIRSVFRVYVNDSPRGYIASEPNSSDLMLEFHLFLRRKYYYDDEGEEEVMFSRWR